jgi:uncharacterized membrane protein YhaH (DUF805 family)
MAEAMPGRAVTSQSWFGFMFSPFGRVSRKQYWLSYVLPTVFLYFIALIVDVAMAAQSGDAKAMPYFANAVVGLFLFWPSFAVAAKRLHDRGMTGWWSLLANGFAPVVILAVAAYWYYATRMKGDGAAPSDPTIGLVFVGVAIVLVLAWLILTIQILFVRGHAGANKYGEDPLPMPEDVRADGVVTTVFAILTIVFFVVPFLAGVAYYYQAAKMRQGADAPTVESLEHGAPPAPGAEPADEPATSPSTPD